MVRQVKNILTESEKDRIRNLHNQPKENRDYIFEACITIDEKYFILHDTVFDIQEQKSLGNVWDSIDVFRTIFNTVKVDDSTGEFNTIRESINKLPILENESNLHVIRDLLIEWSFWDDTWLGSELKNAGTSIANTFKDGFNKLKQLGVAISSGEWKEILNLLGKGVLWILRKLKDAAYSTLGMIVDAILVATGIGKGAQMVAWGLITALDVYQLSTNNWPEGDNRDTFSKYLDLGCDLLGLVFAGVAAKGARAIFKPLQGLSTKEMAVKVAQSPKLKSIIQNIFEATKRGGASLKNVQGSISKKWPSGSKFINSILGSFEKVVNNLRTYLGQILTKSNLKGIQNKKIIPGKGYVAPVKSSKEFIKKGSVAAGVSGGLTYGTEKLFGGEENKQSDFENTIINSKIKPEFDGI